MKKEEKQLLLKDLCARLPYGVKLRYVEDLVVKKESHIITLNNIYLEHILNGDADIKPYLRPMSSMTEEEGIYYNTVYYTLNFYKKEDWLNEHHFDYRGLIPMGLALEAPEDMYK
jgi:hypothetical protein